MCNVGVSGDGGGDGGSGPKAAATITEMRREQGRDRTGFRKWLTAPHHVRLSILLSCFSQKQNAIEDISSSNAVTSASFFYRNVIHIGRRKKGTCHLPSIA